MSAGHTCSTDTGPLALVALKNTRKRKKIESERGGVKEACYIQNREIK